MAPRVSRQRLDDVHRLFAEARKRQKRSGHRVVNLQEKGKKNEMTAMKATLSEPEIVTRKGLGDFDLLPVPDLALL